jgi:hypothetical protein
MKIINRIPWRAVGVVVLITALASCLPGCASVRARLKGGASANAPKDNGTAASVSSGTSVSTVPLPVGSTVETVQGTPETATSPAVPPSVRVTLAAPSELRVETTAEAATTGTIDTATAKHRIDVETASAGRAPLLWAAIVAAGGAVVLMVMKWPTAAMLCGIGSGVFFFAWRVSGLPDWFWFIGAAAVLSGACLMLGYKRAEWDANGDFIPDALQKGKPNP